MSERFNGVARYEREAQPSVLQELNTLRKSFGFEENDKLAELHDVLLLATGQEHTELRRQLTGMYQDQAWAVIDTDPPPDKWYGAAIALASIKLESHCLSACLEDLQDVHYTLCHDSYFEHEADVLHTTMDRLKREIKSKDAPGA
jgi:hypothetical protein